MRANFNNPYVGRDRGTVNARDGRVSFATRKAVISSGAMLADQFCSGSLGGAWTGA